MEKVLPYDLKCGDATSERFYQLLDKYCQEVIFKIYPKYYDLISDYQRYVHRNKIERLRFKEEYLIEYLLIGVLWNRYISSALNPSFMTTQIGLAITNFMKNKPDEEANLLKSSMIDKYFLATSDEEPKFTYENYTKLLDWLEITGQFPEEVKRLSNWEKYLGEKSESEFEELISELTHYTNWLSGINFTFFHEFTKGIFSYMTENIHDKYGDSDIILHEKMPEEYHFNIVAVQIFNSLFRNSFLAAKHKIVILPTCMIPFGAECKAEERNGYRFCSCCNCEKCNIRQVKETLGDAADVMIVEHEYGFKFLENWPDKENYGFVAVSCAITLLNACFEMRNMGFISQFLFLDNCGCFTHWTNKNEEVITGINIKYLFRLMGAGSVDIKGK